MFQSVQNFEFFDKKTGFFSNHFLQSVDGILQDVLVAERMVEW